MEDVLLSLESTGQPELLKIVQALLQKFGNDALDVVTPLLPKENAMDLEKAVKPINKGTSVKTNTPATINPIAQYKAEKKEKNKKEFDMTRWI